MSRLHAYTSYGNAMREIRHGRFICLLLSAVFFVLPSTAAWAGATTRPQNIVFMDISEPAYQDGKALMTRWRAQASTAQLNPLPSENVVDRSSVCQNYECAYTGVDQLFLNRIPQGLTQEDALLAVDGNMAARNRMQTVLENYNLYMDGLVIYRHEPGMVRLYGIPAIPGAPVFFYSKQVEQQLSVDDLDRLLQAILLDFPRRNP